MRGLSRRMFGRLLAAGAGAGAFAAKAQSIPPLAFPGGVPLYTGEIGEAAQDPMWALRKAARETYDTYFTKQRQRREALWVDGLPPDIAACKSWSPAFRRIATLDRDRELAPKWKQMYSAAFGDEDFPAGWDV